LAECRVGNLPENDFAFVSQFPAEKGEVKNTAWGGKVRESADFNRIVFYGGKLLGRRTYGAKPLGRDRGGGDSNLSSRKKKKKPSVGFGEKRNFNKA